VRTFKPADLLDHGRSAQEWDSCDFAKAPKTSRSGDVRFDVTAAVSIQGLALWWSAELVEGVRMSTGPSDPKTHWEQLYLPALEPIAVPAGGALTARLRSKTSYEEGTNVMWTLTAFDAKGRELARQALDLNKGFVP
jgi:type I protein arginine methyltransferase